MSKPVRSARRYVAIWWPNGVRIRVLIDDRHYWVRRLP